MSRVNKLKHVMLAELGSNDFMPPAANQQFARVIKGQGNNLHEVEPAGTLVVSATDADAASTEQSPPPPLTFLASMPLRFRNNIYVKRGTFLIIEMIPEGNKVKAEIARILMPEHVRQFKKDGIWPTKFEDEKQQQKESEEPAKASKKINGSDCGSSDDGSDDDSDLVKNTNGWHGNAESSSESSEVDSSDDGNDDEDSESGDVEDNGKRAVESAEIVTKTPKSKE